MDNFGRIILLQNVVFLGDGRAMTDSKYFRDRPCIVMGESDSEIYVLPLTSNFGYKEGEYNFPLTKDSINSISDYYFKDLSYVKVNNLLKKNLYYYNECGYLKMDSYYKLLLLIKKYLEDLKKNPLNGEIYQEYEMELDRQISILSSKKLVRRKNETKKSKRR